MTNTKFRKRALLSSVAMLLVALVALGSATFAWFVANPTATASGLVMSTNASPGIVVASTSVLALAEQGDDVVTAYKAQTYLNATGTFDSPTAAATVAKDLQPASPDVSSAAAGTLNFYTAKAADSAHSTIAGTPGWTTSSDVYSENVYFKASSLDDNVTGPTVKQATVTIGLNSSAGTVKTGVKVALVSSQGELIGIWKATGGADQKTYSSGALSASPYTCTASGVAKAITTAIPTSSAINNDGTTGNYITAFVYLDGEDQNVYSDNVPRLVNIVDSITISVSTVALS